MLVRHLSYFSTLARERNFARAAERCNITQPTLSAAIRRLEDDLGVPLVVHNQRFIGLTREGEKVLAWSRQILTDYTSLRDDLAGLRRGLTGTLRLGVIPAAMPAVAFVTARFNRRHPAARVEVRSTTSRAIQGALDRFEIDGGMTYLANEPLENVHRVFLYREHLAVRHGHALATRSEIGWSEAAGQRLCLPSEDMQNRRLHPPAGADPIVIVLAGVGWSFLLTPLLAGTVAIVLSAAFYRRIAGRRDPGSARP